MYGLWLPVLQHSSRWNTTVRRRVFGGRRVYKCSHNLHSLPESGEEEGSPTFKSDSCFESKSKQSANAARMSSFEDKCFRVCTGHLFLSSSSPSPSPCRRREHGGKRGRVMRRWLPASVIFSDLVNAQTTILLRNVLPSDATMAAASAKLSRGRSSTKDGSPSVGSSGASDTSHWMRGSQ